MTLPVPNFENVPPSNETELVTAITTTAQSVFDVDTGQGADYPTTDFVVLIEDELLFIASRSGDTFTVATIGTDGFDGRGWDGTTPALHAATTRVEAAFSAADLVNAWKAYNEGQDDQFAGLPEKTSPDDDDLFLLEDSAASGAKKSVKKSNIGGGGGGGVPADSIIGRLYTAPVSVRGLTRTYDSDTDEFEDGAITGWTQVDGSSSAAPTWFEDGHAMGCEWAPGIGVSNWHAQMKPINPSGDFVLETAFRYSMSDDQFLALMLADGTGLSGTNQAFYMIYGGVNSNFTHVVRYGVDTNYGPGTPSGSGPVLDEIAAAAIYLRVEWDDTGGTVDFSVSADGVGQFPIVAGHNPGFTPTHYGVAFFALSNTGGEAAYEYFRVFTEV